MEDILNSRIYMLLDLRSLRACACACKQWRRVYKIGWDGYVKKANLLVSNPYNEEINSVDLYSVNIYKKSTEDYDGYELERCVIKTIDNFECMLAYKLASHKTHPLAPFDILIDGPPRTHIDIIKGSTIARSVHILCFECMYYKDIEPPTLANELAFDIVNYVTDIRVLSSVVIINKYQRFCANYKCNCP